MQTLIWWALPLPQGPRGWEIIAVEMRGSLLNFFNGRFGGVYETLVTKLEADTDSPLKNTPCSHETSSMWVGDGKTTANKMGIFKGGGHWGQRGKSPKNAVFLAKRHVNKILKVQTWLAAIVLSLRTLPVIVSSVCSLPLHLSFFLWMCTYLHVAPRSSHRRCSRKKAWGWVGECPWRSGLMMFRRTPFG